MGSSQKEPAGSSPCEQFTEALAEARQRAAEIPDTVIQEMAQLMLNHLAANYRMRMEFIGFTTLRDRIESTKAANTGIFMKDVQKARDSIEQAITRRSAS